MVQKHLTYKEMTDNGCFYTPTKFVLKTIELIKENVPNYENFVYLDSSCGYGAFLERLPFNRKIGCDIDEVAIKKAKTVAPEATYYKTNSLLGFTRKTIEVEEEENLIIIGNPPYNDYTSKVKNAFKNSSPCDMDDDLKTRDLGISFLLSFNKLRPNYVAVLHPLSYMIKKANYNLLKPFFDNYGLADHCVINSQEFGSTSKIKGFPIIIALYKRDDEGLPYQTIMNMNFKTADNSVFNFKLDFIGNYIKKYPAKKTEKTENDILFFTMRDINALNRSKTFIQNYSANAVVIDKKNFAYYCYVDVFKQYIKYLPYYYGNLEVFINNDEFLKIKDVFISNSVARHPWLEQKGVSYNKNPDFRLIDEYFKKLFNFGKTDD